MSHFTDENGGIGSPASDPLPVWDDSAAVLSVRKKEYWILLRGHRGSETFLCCPTW